MRVKQTAKKISTENPTLVNTEHSDHNSCDIQNDISDNEVEFLVECRRDQEGNQFLLDGTLVIEPAAVETSSEFKENQNATKEINFDQFIKEILTLPPQNNTEKNSAVVVPKRSVNSFGPSPTSFSTVKCTACNKKFNPFMGQPLFKHPLMEVILCSDCIQNQKEEFFVIDKEDNKETLCRWCVEGGSLICCDFCPKSFCKACIKRNLGRSMLTEILNQDDSVQWKCFVCEPRAIESLKIHCTKIYTEVRQFANKQRFQKIAKKPIVKVSEIVNKKRSINKAFPHEATNGTPDVTVPKIATPSSPPTKAPLLNNMANFGTDWYMRNVKLRTIFAEIDEIDSRSLLNAINSTKKCVEAFYSDIRNLEVEISKATTSTDITAIVSMFKSVYRHHIFNRFCQVKTRIEEDKKSKFVGQTLVNTNGTEFIIKGTNAPPNMVINNVVSTATKKRKSLSPTNIVRSVTSTPLSNGGTNHNTANVMASIDLTDDSADKSGQHSPIGVVVHEQDTATSINPSNGVLHKIEAEKNIPDEVVDLCEDDDVVLPLAYPVVNMNINNQLLPHDSTRSATITALADTDDVVVVEVDADEN